MSDSAVALPVTNSWTCLIKRSWKGLCYRAEHQRQKRKLSGVRNKAGLQASVASQGPLSLCRGLRVARCQMRPWVLPAAGSWNRDLCVDPPRAQALGGNEHTSRDVFAPKSHLEVGCVGVSVIRNAGLPALPQGYFRAWFYDGFGDSRGHTRAVITVSGKDESRVFWALLLAKEPSPRRSPSGEWFSGPHLNHPRARRRGLWGRRGLTSRLPPSLGRAPSGLSMGWGQQMTRRPSARPVVSSWHLAHRQRKSCSEGHFYTQTVRVPSSGGGILFPQMQKYQQPVFRK